MYIFLFKYAHVRSISNSNNVFVFHLLLTFEIFFFYSTFEGDVSSYIILTSSLHCGDEIYNKLIILYHALISSNFLAAV